MRRAPGSCPAVWLGLVPFALLRSPAHAGTGLKEKNEALCRRLAEVHGYSASQIESVRRILERSRFAGQGNPAITRHPMTPEECMRRAAESAVAFEDPRSERICGARYMVPLYDPQREKPEDARACIDQLEFPDIPCAYPVVWIRANEAAEVCQALGKRLCDAHEWEGGCAGRLLAPDYRFDLARGLDPAAAVRRMRDTHNRGAELPGRDGSPQLEKTWSYGPAYRSGTCGTSSHKSPGCPGGGWDRCGSNTFPSGSFPGCRSPLGVFDLNGNAAEHMNLPLDESQMASLPGQGSGRLGVTEMKGSWFAFDDFRAHEDWCRWRAPFWHGTRVRDPRSHANYHLGFRCCKSLGVSPTAPAAGP